MEGKTLPKQMDEAGALLAWYDSSKRDLPWRRDADPYRVWVSEIMLQQTRVEAARGYYDAFLARFPDVDALAAADLESVFKMWEGLGYYSRAKRLWEAAKIVAAEGFPRDAEGWRALPGAGEYTAAAVASICYGERVLAVDGNVARVIMRRLGLRERADLPSAKRAVRAAGIGYLPRERPGDGNQALIELGATVCVPRVPRCDRCPIAAGCVALGEGVAAEIPAATPRKGKAVERLRVALILRGGRVALRRRPEEGLLAGQWEFPHGLSARQTRGMALLRELTPYRHVFTHKIWEVSGAAYAAAADAAVGANLRWVSRDELIALPIPSAMAPVRAAALELLP